MSDSTEKNTSGESANGNRFVLVERADTVPRPREPLPLLSPVDASALRALLEKASSAPDDWYRLPGTQLAVASVSIGRAGQTIRFEIRDESSGEVRRYHYDARYRLLTHRRNEAIEHPEIPSGHQLPSDSHRLALSVVALADSSHIPTITIAVSTDEVENERPATRDHEGIGYAFIDLVRRVTSHWFGSDPHGWGPAKRFATAFVGSLSFFIVWLFAAISPDIRRLILDLQYQTAVLLSQVYVLLIVGWFAWLVSCRDQQYGPARLYLAGFLLPYFIWGLVDIAFDVDRMFSPNTGGESKE